MMRPANGTNYAPESTADGLVFAAKVLGGKKKRGGQQLQSEVSGSKNDDNNKQKKNAKDRRETSHLGLLFPTSALLATPRHVEVSAWIPATQEFMSVIFRGAIQARPGPIKRSQ